MASVTRIEDNVYEVEDFVRSLPHLRYQVSFGNNIGRVTVREGCTSTEWDKHAISAVQFSLITSSVTT